MEQIQSRGHRSAGSVILLLLALGPILFIGSRMILRPPAQGCSERSNSLDPMREITYRQAVNEALAEEMERDPNVFLMGEEVAEYNGAYKISQGPAGDVSAPSA